MDDFAAREKQFVPKPRPEWVRRLNEEGECMDIKSVVPLDENSLIRAAKANTGLRDFGDDEWVEPFQVLIKAFDEESRLHLMGRIMTRMDMLMFLEARLRIAETYKRHPEIDDQQITKPMMIIGQGRSGTSALQNMLSKDPQNETITNWEVFFPCPPPEKATFHSDPRIAKTEHVFGLFRRVIPEIDSMHEFTAEAPTENIHLHCLSFRCVPWINSFGGQVPSYNAYMAKQSMVPAYQYEKRVLKLLQWKNPRKWWLLKSPPSIAELPEVLKIYPDMGFLWIHRDPVKAIASMTNLIGTLFWSRTDHPFLGNSLDAYTRSDLAAAKMAKPIEWLENGALPHARLCNVQYYEFMEEPLRVAQQIYDYFGYDMPPESEKAMRDYMDANPREGRPAHTYKTGDSELIQKERALYARYQQYFNVPNEF
jgi:Sulfotransferase family